MAGLFPNSIHEAFTQLFGTLAPPLLRTPRRGEVASYAGELADVLHPLPAHYALDELGGLAQVNRWGGRSVRPYPVAAHCLHAAELARYLYPDAAPWLRLAVLLHDAPELYLGDMPTPLKILPEMAWYRTLEAEHAACVEEAYHLPPGALDCAERKEVDHLSLLIEAHYLVRQRQRWSAPLESALPERLRLFAPRLALEPWPRTSAEGLATLYVVEVDRALGAWHTGRPTLPDAAPPTERSPGVL